MYNGDFLFDTAGTLTLRVESLMLKINLAALMWIFSRAWSELGDPQREIEWVIHVLGSISLK